MCSLLLRRSIEFVASAPLDVEVRRHRFDIRISYPCLKAFFASFDGIVKSQFTVSTNLDLTTEYNPLEERPLFLKSAQDLGIEFGAVCRVRLFSANAKSIFVPALEARLSRRVEAILVEF